MQILIDTNVLLRSVDDGHAQQAAAAMSLDRCRAMGHRSIIFPQVLYEFWVVATRPVGRNGLELTTVEADREIRKLLKFCKLLRDERAIFDRWIDLVKRYDVKGKNAHDARLVAAMERHDVTHILTFNVKDFERYQGILAIQPDDLLDGRVSLNGKR